MGTRASQWCAAALLLAGLAAPAAWINSTGARPAAAADDLAEFKEQLRFGLLVERPEDQEYINRVVAMVEQGRLPIALVKSTFQWARNRKKPYPFPYFKRALEIRAGEIGVRVE